MKSYFLLGLFFCAFTTDVYAQEITIYKTFGGVRFERDTITLSTKMVSEILRENPLAYEEFRKAKVNYNVAGVLGFTGGVLIVVPVTTSILGGDPEWALAIGGAALVIGSIQFNRIFKARAVNALDIYNGKVIFSRIKPEFHFKGTQAVFSVRF